MYCICGQSPSVFPMLVLGPLNDPLDPIPKGKASEMSVNIVKKAHAQFVGAGSVSLKRYRTTVNQFFTDRRNSGIRPSILFGELDNQIGEYLDFISVWLSPSLGRVSFIGNEKDSSAV